MERKNLFNGFMTIVLLLTTVTLTRAQDVGCGTCGGPGTYINPQNLIINDIGSHTIGTTNGLDFNTLGGGANVIKSSNQSTDVSFIYGTNDTIDNCQACIALGENNGVRNGSPSAAIGDNNTVDGSNSYAIGEKNILREPTQYAFGKEIKLNRSNNLGFGSFLKTNNSDAMVIGFGSSNRLTDIGSNTITMGVDANNMLNLFLNTNGNPTVGINRTSIANTGVDLTVGGDAEKFGGSQWINLSDKRLKTNVKNFEDGLKTLMDIDPKWYQYNGKLNTPTEGKHVGIIAQELKEVAPYMIMKNENGYYSYDANALQYILVNAVQEQQKLIQEEKQQRKEKIEELEQRIADLEAKVKANHGDADAAPKVKPEKQKTVQLNNENIDEPVLYQNIPNPFRDETVIKYYLPDNSRNSELLIASAKKGTVLKRINLEASGKGQINLQTNDLKPGTYTYTLLVNGEQVQSRKMVIKP